MRTLILAGLLVASTACAELLHGSGVIRTESRNVAEFAEVDLSGGLDVTIRTGPTAVVVEGDDNLLRLYRTEVTEGRLVIGPKQGSLVPTRPIKVTVTTPHLRSVEASGGVEVLIEGSTDKALSLELSGGVDLKAPALDVETLELEASGGVDLELGGRAGSATLELSGGVNVRGRQLEVASAQLDASGGCDVGLQVTGSITGDASGGVDVTVYGNPPKSRLHASGGAEVTFRDAQ